ncbi:rdgB HAM1 family non-canonical purine NT protein [Tubulinosema ratisbonensis]|uniref:RdgB HAM1 family non-canonical purine NT protein n=1 Tax=Tubulinosema ratisbonensis TaxID=291195 RepID=A0A437AMB0_9MICR|nr:rdgB HAM1 family non-canonical purine NT protein [Tubulinosema ratisbonensis]
MKVIFLTSKEERYEEFKMLVPFKTAMVKYIERSNHRKEKIEIILPQFMNVTLEKDDLIIVDFMSYELYALNGLPGRNNNFIFRVGLENIQNIAKLRGKTMIQKTQFKILNDRFKCVKMIDYSIKGCLLVDKYTKFKDLDDLFLLESYIAPFSRIPLRERAIIGSIGMASKLFIDWALRNGYDYNN